ncbi:serine hydrolase [Psychrobacillus sp. FSL W7-1493]|uniref:serine hydrolase n=1 Tax=Psychrobacillus sp. FSL W7-1493 TaxID=2921552 RepID=UPI0030F61C72
MENILEKLKEIKQGEVGAILYSPLHDKNILSLNADLNVPLASAAKVAIAFCIVKLVEEKKFKWTDIIQNIKLNPKEDSDILYPHYQNRSTLMLHEAVEVMIACHDSHVANSIVQLCGGWTYLNQKIQSYFKEISVRQNPKDLSNEGKLSHILELLKCVIKGYESEPEVWAPLVNGLVRQRGEIKEIPNHLINHMTGGLDNVVIDIGVIGKFSSGILLFVIGAKHLPNRFEEQWADEKLEETLSLIFKEYGKGITV